MLREYRLTNFKAFGETVTIPIRPLTLIFGANSSGKSSIFQSLLLLKQTLEKAKNPATVLLPKGSLVDLGTYRDFVHRHETERDFEFGAQFDLEEIDSLPELARKIIESMDVKNAGLTIQFSSDEESQATALRHVDIAIGDQEQVVISYLYLRQQKFIIDGNRLISAMVHLDKLCTALREENKSEEANAVEAERDGVKKQFDKLIENSEWVKIEPELEFWRHWWRCTKSYIRSYFEESDLEEVWLYKNQEVWLYKNPEGERADLLEELENYQLEDAVKDIGNALCKSDVEYRNFLPESPEVIGDSPFRVRFRTRHPDSLSAKDEYINGLDVSPFTLQACSTFRRLLEDLVYLGPLRSYPERHYEFSGDTTDYVGQSGEYLPSILFEDQELVEQINSDLGRIGVKYQVKLDKLQYEDKNPSNVFSLRLIDKAGIDASLRDVGFGISQVLPIVAQNRLSKKKTLLIEQPEIHLHPAHQAELGDLFIRSALGEQRNTILLETHSEHLMLRILRRIRETSENEPLPEGIPAIRPEDVAVLYVQPGEGDEGAQVIEIPVTADGDFARLWPEGFFVERSKELF